MAVPNWVNSEDWDALRLGGMRIPGVWQVKAHVGSGLDVKKPKGGKKATTKDDGDPLVEFEAEGSLSHADLVEFSDIFGVLRPVTKNGARSPLKFDHPIARVTSVFNVTVGDVDLDHPESGGRMTVSMKLIEWAPAPTVVKPSEKKPVDDAEDIAASAPFADDGVAGSGAVPLQYRKPPAGPRASSIATERPPIRKPSQDAGKNI